MANNRFILQPSKKHPGSWVCTDTKNGIVCIFKEHLYNDTQDFTFIDTMQNPDALAVARMMREMGDWLRANHYDKIF